MSKKRKSGAKLLTILWLLTAISALVVTIVYFGKIGELYSALGEIQANGSPASAKVSGKNDGKPVTQTPDEPEDTKGGLFIDGSVEDAADDSGRVTSDDSDSPVTEVADNTEPGGDVPDDNEPAPTDVPQDTGDHPYYYDPNLDPSKPIIALSFDDGPSSNTEKILETLEIYGAKATFFMVGYQIEAYSDSARAVYEAGCEIGNHTSNHKKLDSLSKDQIRKEVFENEDLINKYAPVGHVVVRPPYGNYNDTVREVVDRPMFNWSVDSLDWKSRDADAVFKEIKAQAKDGYIILCHDLYGSTAEAVEKFLPWLIEQGYQVTCISNMYAARGEKTLDGHVYRYTNPAPKTSE